MQTTVNIKLKQFFFLSFSSTCHGAGRALSRAKSRRNIGYQEVLDKLQAQGISIRVGKSNSWFKISPLDGNTLEVS